MSLVAGVGGADDDGDAIELLHYITSVNHTKTQVFSLLGFCFLFFCVVVVVMFINVNVICCLWVSRKDLKLLIRLFFTQMEKTIWY